MEVKNGNEGQEWGLGNRDWEQRLGKETGNRDWETEWRLGMKTGENGNEDENRK